MFLEKGVLKICSKCTGEHPCRSVISTKLLGNFIEITLWHGCSPVNLLHIFGTHFTKNSSGRLLLNSTSKLSSECIKELIKVRINNTKNLIFATLNVNSLVSKFDELKVIGQGIFYILIINETKLDASFPVNHFCINSVSSTPCRLDSKDSLKLIKSYLTNRWQRTKLNTGFSKWTEILLGASRRSVLEPLLLNIYINNLFFSTEGINVCNYADDATFYAYDSDLHSLISRLEHDFLLAI